MNTTFRTVRLRRHADYGLVYGASRKHRSATLSFFYRNAGENPARFGITTPRALGPSVLRNRIKRRLRMAARAALPLLPPGTDVVLHPRPEVATMAFPALEQEIATVFATVARRLSANADNTPLPRRPRAQNPQRKPRP